MQRPADLALPTPNPHRALTALLLALLVSCACQAETYDPGRAADNAGAVDSASSDTEPEPAAGAGDPLSAARAQPQALLSVDFEDAAPGAPPPGWRAVALGEAPATTWTVVTLEQGHSLRAEADGGASGLVQELAAPAGRLGWRWRVEAQAPGARDERTRAGDDFAARVLVSFASRPGAGLADSLADAAARLAGHEQVPAAALAYVVARDLPAGTHFESPYTERVHTFVLRGRGDPLGGWMSEQRDLAADFETAFGRPISTVTGLQLLTDSDNGGGRAVALYDDLLLLPPVER